MGYGQLEVLDFIPVVRVGLGHHGLLPLAEKGGVAGSAAESGFLEIIVFTGTQRRFAGFNRFLGRDTPEQDENQGNGEKINRYSSSSFFHLSSKS